MRVLRPLKWSQCFSWANVAVDAGTHALRVRKEMEQTFSVEPAAFTEVSALGVEEQRVRVQIDITSPQAESQALGDGYRVSVRIVTLSEATAVQVPVSAVFPQPGGAVQVGAAAAFPPPCATGCGLPHANHDCRSLCAPHA